MYLVRGKLTFMLCLQQLWFGCCLQIMCGVFFLFFFILEMSFEKINRFHPRVCLTFGNHNMAYFPPLYLDKGCILN